VKRFRSENSSFSLDFLEVCDSPRCSTLCSLSHNKLLETLNRARTEAGREQTIEDINEMLTTAKRSTETHHVRLRELLQYCNG
jgi:hypothetical protein